MLQKLSSQIGFNDNDKMLAPRHETIAIANLSKLYLQRLSPLSLFGTSVDCSSVVALILSSQFSTKLEFRNKNLKWETLRAISLTTF